MKQFRQLIFATLFFAAASTAKTQAPAPYATGSKINYVRVWEAAVPETNAVNLMTRPVEEVKQTTKYFDGMGRGIQLVEKQGSLIKDPNNSNNDILTDLVSSSFYDNAGRQQYQYLPFAANNANGNVNIDNGLLKMNPFQQQEALMQSLFPGENFYYRKNEFESTPTGKVVKSLEPGISWAGSNRGSELQYTFNAAEEGIRVWQIDFSMGSVPYSTATYAAGKLSKLVMIDEAGKKVYNYINSEGNVLLKKYRIKNPARV